MTAFRQHFEEQEYYYGRQFLISLVRNYLGKHFEKQKHTFQVNQHGAEGKLNAKYRELFDASQNLYIKYKSFLSHSYPTLLSRFEDFDFHKECAGMRYDRLTILLARVIADQDDYRYDESKMSIEKIFLFGLVISL